MTDHVIKTARRLFEVLEYFDDVKQPVSLKQIASHFGYPVSSASALLKSMVTMGYIDYDVFSRTYMPTMRLAGLGNWIGGMLFGDGRIMSLVRHVNERTRAAVAIATQSDLFTQYLHVVPSLEEVPYHLKPGLVRPLVRSGLGWLLLSARSDDTIDWILRRSNAQEEDRANRVMLPELMEKIETIRRDGYVYSRHTVNTGAGIIGMLLPERRHGRILAIGAGGLIERLDEMRDEIVEVLRDGIDKFLADGDGGEL